MEKYSPRSRARSGESPGTNFQVKSVRKGRRQRTGEEAGHTYMFTRSVASPDPTGVCYVLSAVFCLKSRRPGSYRLFWDGTGEVASLGEGIGRDLGGGLTACVTNTCYVPGFVLSIVCVAGGKHAPILLELASFWERQTDCYYQVETNALHKDEAKAEVGGPK